MNLYIINVKPTPNKNVHYLHVYSSGFQMGTGPTFNTNFVNDQSVNIDSRFYSMTQAQWNAWTVDTDDYTYIKTILLTEYQLEEADPIVTETPVVPDPIIPDITQPDPAIGGV